MFRLSRVLGISVVAMVAGLLAACNNSVPTVPNTGVQPMVTAITLTPATVQGGQTTTVNVTLSFASPAGGSQLTLASNNPMVTTPTTIMVNQGGTTGTATITTPQIGSTLIVGITAALNGTVQTTLTITPTTPLTVTGFSIANSPLPSGETTSGMITLSAPAFTVGQPVSILSSNPVVNVPSPITVSGGRTMASFNVFTNPVTSPVTVTLTATLNNSTQMATLMLMLPPPTLNSLTIVPNPVVGGSQATGTVALNQPAGMGGVVISLMASDTVTVPNLPASVTIPQNATQAQFMFTPIMIQGTRQVQITAQQNAGTLNSVTESVIVNVVSTPLAVSTITLNPATTTGGLPVNGTVTINGFAPQGGQVVMLSSNNPSASVPPTVTIPAGTIFTSFPVMTNPVATTQMATISGVIGTGTPAMAMLTVDAASSLTVSSISLSPTTVAEGQQSTGTVTISGLAPPGGSMVMLTSGDPSVTFDSTKTASATVTVPTGATTASFLIDTTSGTAASAKITVSLNGSLQNATLMVVAPPTLVSVTLTGTCSTMPCPPNPVSIVGGNSSFGTVTLSAVAPGGTPTTVNLMSSDTTHAQVAASVDVPAGSTTANFLVSTFAVPSPLTVTISAQLASGGATQMAPLTLTEPPPTVAEIFFNPPTIAAGASSTGTLVLNELSPPGGTSVTLSVPSGTTAVTLPQTTVMIPAGMTTATFAANAAASVSSSTVVHVTATLNSSTPSNTLTVVPAASGTVSEQIIVGGETNSTDFPVIPNPGAFQTTLTGSDSGTLTSINLSTTGGVISSSGTFSTYLSNSTLGQVRDTFVDSSGNIFVCGVTSDMALPTSASGVAQRTYGGGNSDAFIAEFNAMGQVQFLTYLGGEKDDSCNGILVDSSGNIFVSGHSDSTMLMGPSTTPAVVQPTCDGVTMNMVKTCKDDFFIAKLAPKAASITWLTFLGGLSDDEASGRITEDSSGNVYVSGVSQSLTDFPIATGQGRPFLGGVAKFGVVVKLNPTATQITYSAFLFGHTEPSGVSGGTTADASGGLVVTSSGVVYVCGAASATDFPATPGAFQTIFQGNQDAYVAELAANGTIKALTLLGGTGNAQACKGIAADSEGNILVATVTDAANFPSTGGIGPRGGPSDVAITKLSPDLSTVIFSTIIGGSQAETADATRVELDPSENIYFSVATNSGDFPGMASNSFQQFFKGTAGGADNNMAIVKLSADGSSILYATYLGGSMQNSTITLRYHHN